MTRTSADAWQEVPGAAAATKAGVETIWYAPNVRGNGSQHGFVVHSSANNLIDLCVFVVRGLAVKPIDQVAKSWGQPIQKILYLQRSRVRIPRRLYFI